MAQLFKKGNVVKLKNEPKEMLVTGYRETLTLDGIKWALSNSRSPQPTVPESHDVECQFIKDGKQVTKVYHEGLLELIR